MHFNKKYVFYYYPCLIELVSISFALTVEEQGRVNSINPYFDFGIV
jgi:hypothetical protein